MGALAMGASMFAIFLASVALFIVPVTPVPVLVSTAALAAPAPQEPAAETLSPAQLEDALAPRTLGSADAPVTFTEYSSLSCGHCARFHADTLPALKEKYVDTGRVRFVYVDFPTNAPALEARWPRGVFREIILSQLCAETILQL